MKIEEGMAAVVTAAASGLGNATAKRLSAQGVKVAVFDINEELGLAAAGEIGGVFCKVDVTSDASVNAGFEKARAAHGQERILVNCAGIARGGKPSRGTGKSVRSGVTRPARSNLHCRSIWWASSAV